MTSSKELVIADLAAARLGGNGAYTVMGISRILGNDVTPRKIHYWLDTDLLGEPIRRGGAGHPTLLTFEQLLRIQTIARLRADVSLQQVRRAIGWILTRLFAESWEGFEFSTAGSDIILSARGQEMRVPGGQLILEASSFAEIVASVREAWNLKKLEVPGYPLLVSNARILGGSPTIAGTRIETSFIAVLVVKGISGEKVWTITQTYPWLYPDQVEQAISFEARQIAA